MLKLKTFLLTIAFSILPVLSTSADQEKHIVKLKSGVTLKGQVLSVGEKTFTFKSQHGKLTIPLSQIVSLRKEGQVTTYEPGSKTDKKTGTASSEMKSEKTVDVETEKKADSEPEFKYAVEVGNAGITAEEFEDYVIREAHQLRKPIHKLQIHERVNMLQQAIDEELIFQEAIAKKTHEQPYIRKLIIGQYEQILAKERHEKAKEFTEEDLKKYYEAHPEQFTHPDMVKLAVHPFKAGTPMDEIKQWMSKAKADAGSVQWKAMDWLKKDQTYGNFDLKSLKPLHELSPGEMTDVIHDPFGLNYVFKCIDKRQGGKQSFEQCKDEIVKILNDEHEAELRDKLRAQRRHETKSGDTLNDTILQQAIDRNVHRMPHIRTRIINTYTHKSGVERDKLLVSLRETYEININIQP